MRNLLRRKFAFFCLLCFSISFSFSGCDSTSEGTHASHDVAVEESASTTRSADFDLPPMQLTYANEPTDDEPVSLAFDLDRDEAAAGEFVTLMVGAKIAEGWHIYAVEGPTGVARPTRLSTQPPMELISASDWKLPKPKMKASTEGMTAVHMEEVVFAKQFVVASDAATGPITLPVEIQYQVCKSIRCLPPNTITIEVPLTITPEITEGQTNDE